MTTIRIADPIRPARSNENLDGSGIGSGIYNIRTASLDRRNTRGRRGSVDVRSVKTVDAEDAEDEDSGLREAGDFKKKQVNLNSTPKNHAGTHKNRYSKGDTCYGSHINPLASFMVTSGPVRCMCTRRLSPQNHLIKISWGFYQLLSGRLP